MIRVPADQVKNIKHAVVGKVNMPDFFKFSSINAGVKSPESTRLDLGLIYCEQEAAVAGVFTTNAVKAAPVLIDMDIVRQGKARAILINSGNANACTGENGIQDARRTMQAAARQLRIETDEVIPMSTGVIGERLPAERIEAAVPQLVRNLGDDIDSFAKAILTTDTCTKVSERSVGEATVLGVAKGSGMIAPNMATTLAIVMTDAVATPEQLQQILDNAVKDTFNAISVDGDTSTNDMVLLMANGLAGNPLIEEKDKNYEQF